MKLRNICAAIALLVICVTAYATTFKNWKVTHMHPGPVYALDIVNTQGQHEVILVTQHQWDRVLAAGGNDTIVTCYDENGDGDTKDPNESVIVGPL